MSKNNINSRSKTLSSNTKIFRINDEDDYAKEEYLKKQVSIIPKNLSIIPKNLKKELILFNNRSIKLINIKSNNSSYKDSNLLSFLTLLCKKNLMNNVRIVCHSGIMKTFVKKLELLKKKQTFLSKIIYKSNNSSNNNDALKDLVKKQNLWTLFLKNNNEFNNNFNISISRHAYTFANLLKEKGRSIEQTREKDTQLSLYGILTALNHGNNLVDNETFCGLEETPKLVYVSVLIRTWMTAICLYLPHNTSNTFTLVVSPFLKEEGSTPDNTPEEFSNQIKNINIFLKYLMMLEVDDDNINKNINNIKKFFEQDGKLIIIKSKDKQTITFNNNKNNNKNNNNSPNYFNSNNSNNSNSNCDNLSFSKIIIFDGIEKLNPKSIITSRWCEPFAKQEKFIGFGQNTCVSRMKKIA
jgi:hypothetical protein